jgi:hypothetical protein
MDTLTILIYYCTVIYSMTTAEMKSRAFILEPSFHNKVSQKHLIAEYNSASVSICTAMCDELCSCVGFNHLEKKCRIHHCCRLINTDTEETGWRYFIGMLYQIPHICFIYSQKSICWGKNKLHYLYFSYS